MSSPDPFSARFDSIEIDPARAPSQAALDHAFAIAAPSAAAPDFTTPGFYLLDDSGGRFEVDREFGVISLRDESILDREQGAVHTARLRVIEPSGASYDIDMRLRLTGRVPQMDGAEDFTALATLASSTAPVTTPPLARATIAWSDFAVATQTHAAEPLGGEAAPFGALLSTQLPAKGGSTAFLTLGELPPAPAARDAAWLI